jgi:hypothetical protein
MESRRGKLWIQPHNTIQRMKQTKLFLETWGLHSFLLPVFFVLHNYKQYYGLVSGAVAMEVFCKILAFFIIFFLLMLVTTKKLNKSLQLTTLFGFVFLFYGVIKDFFQFTLGVPFLSKYTVLLPVVFVSTILLIRLIQKKKDYRKSNLFQNTLLLVFIFIDGILFASDNSLFLKQNLLTKNERLDLDKLPIPSSKPDVYYLVFDSYPGSSFLRDYMQFDNSLLDSSLTEKGFHILKDPESNYNRTAFSIASTLNFEYLETIKDFSLITSKDYNLARLTIEKSTVPKVFRSYNYDFYNLSIFNIADLPSIYRENFLTLPEQNVLLHNTLLERLRSDLLWNLMMGKFSIRFVQKMYEVNEDEYISRMKRERGFNDTVIDSLLKIPLQKTGHPKFIYAHLYLPHPPFFYDENGKQNDFKDILPSKSLENKPLFFSYLKYTNKVILEVTSQIIQSAGKNTVIVVQSDHGYRDFNGEPPKMLFKNYSAFYFPDRNYSSLYDTMSNINTFPVIFNKYFNTKIPLQKDTTVFLAY